MVTIYDISSKDTSKFKQEMDNISTSIFKILVEDRITDDQFEKLLKRRDDLTERANIKQPPSPQKLTTFLLENFFYLLLIGIFQ